MRAGGSLFIVHALIVSFRSYGSVVRPPTFVVPVVISVLLFVARTPSTFYCTVIHNECMHKMTSKYFAYVYQYVLHYVCTTVRTSNTEQDIAHVAYQVPWYDVNRRII